MPLYIIWSTLLHINAILLTYIKNNKGRYVTLVVPHIYSVVRNYSHCMKQIGIYQYNIGEPFVRQSS